MEEEERQGDNDEGIYGGLNMLNKLNILLRIAYCVLRMAAAYLVC